MTDLALIGVVGAGQMGSGIAQVFAAAGHPVVLTDLNDDALQRGMLAISDSLERFERKGVLEAQARTELLQRIRTSTALEALQPCTLVVEAASEDQTLKLDLFRQLDCICNSDCVLASNTSSISLTRIAAATSRPDQVIGMHFMNPVPMMELVEVIRALQTSDTVYQRVVTLAESLRKTPVPCNDSPGFVANRILMPMINEAVFVLHEGTASATAIDDIMRLGMSHPMGPLALADLIGLDTCLAIMRVLHDGLGDSKYRPCPLLVQMVDAGYLGRKSGRGFFQYA